MNKARISGLAAAMAMAMAMAIGLLGTYGVAAGPAPAAKGLYSYETDAYGAYLSEHGGLVTTALPPIELTDATARRWTKAGEALTFSFTVADAGFYALRMEYRSITAGGNDHMLSMALDGKEPFYGATQLKLPRYWTYGDIHPDTNGNDIRPEASEAIAWYPYDACDQEGMYAEPYRFYLTPGEHTLSLTLTDGAPEIRGLTFYTPEEIPDYAAYQQAHADIPTYEGAPIPQEAESFHIASSPSVTATNDMSSPLTTPYSAHKILLNTLGGANWKYNGQRVQWTIEAPQTAMYRLSIRYKQSFSQGMTSYRRLLINDAVPYKEAESLRFQYENQWNYLVMETTVYLQEGPNELALECTMGEAAPLLRDINEMVFQLNALYRHIRMVTGNNPDQYRDYHLDKEISGLHEDLTTLSAAVAEESKQLKALTGRNDGQVSTLEDTARQLRDMAADIRSITKGGRLERLKSNISAIASLGMQLREQPLQIDWLELTAPGSTAETPHASFWQQAGHNFQRFLASFVEDYGSYATGTQHEAITVWTQAGRDQMMILKNQIENDFTPHSGVPVRLELVNGSVIEATLAGKGPDVALGRAESEVVNFAMRDALMPLENCPDFGKVKSRFSKTALLPYTYEGSVYGLPESQTFDMLFVRTDILDELGLKLPETWDDFTTTVFSVLQRNNMTIGIGNLNKAATIDASNMFYTLLYQQGGSMYTDDWMRTSMDTLPAFEAFDQAVSLYKDYGVPQEYDFMNRFRTGEMPIAIAPYTSYNNLKAGAPEISGLWEMRPIPGMRQKDGTINRTQLMTSSAAVAFRGAANTQGCWSFLNWWTDAQTQQDFGWQQEAVLGPSGRYATANLEAMKGLSWGAAQLAMLEDQREQSTSFVQIPGSYYTAKAINNAMVIAVTQEGVNAREELIYWTEQIDRELERKRDEFHFRGRVPSEANS